MLYSNSYIILLLIHTIPIFRGADVRNIEGMTYITKQ